jgi:hypothetical protein
MCFELRYTLLYRNFVILFCAHTTFLQAAIKKKRLSHFLFFLMERFVVSMIYTIYK